MKYFAILAAGTLVLAPATSMACSVQDEVTVRGDQLTRSQWVKAVSTRLEAVLSRQRQTLSTDNPTSTGIVSVQFTLDGRNQPAGFQLARSSKNKSLDRLGLRAVGRLGQLPAFATTLPAGQVFRANMIFASDYLDYKEKLSILNREAKLVRSATLDQRGQLASIVTLGAGATS